jgi:hypothetical protein
LHLVSAPTSRAQFIRAGAWEAFIHIALLTGRFRNLSLAFSEKLCSAIPHLEPTQPVNRTFIAPPVWSKQDTLTELNLQATPFPDLLSASTMQPGLAYHKSKRKEK